MVMTDRQTGSIWSHLDGLALQGPLQGSEMEYLPLLHTTWEEWMELNPDTTVLSDDTPFQERYRDVQLGLPNRNAERDLLSVDTRLESEELVFGVFTGDTYVAYPLDELTQTDGVLNETVSGAQIVIFYDAGAESAIAFSRVVDGQTATFERVDGSQFLVRDNETGSTWDITGQAVSGPALGGSLAYVASYISEWYGWSAYHPSTTIFQQ